MAISDALLPEFEREMENTRKTLERVPEDKFAWKPHEKSMALGRLAQHLTEIPGWGRETLTKESVDMSGPYQPPKVETRQQLLDIFDRNQTEVRDLLKKATDQDFMKPWALLSGGKTIFSMPRVAVWRAFIMNHMIHHRAQLGVYLRLNNIPVPSIYGPSADEGQM